MAKLTKENKRNKQVEQFMDLYGLDRTTAKEVCKGVEALLKDQREEMGERLKEMFGDWWAGEGKADNVLIDRKRVLEEIVNYLKQND